MIWWYMYTLWKDSSHWVNTPIISHIYLFKNLFILFFPLSPLCPLLPPPTTLPLHNHHLLPMSMSSPSLFLFCSILLAGGGGRTFKFYSLSKFQLYSKLLAIIVTCYTLSSQALLITESFYLFTNLYDGIKNILKIHLGFQSPPTSPTLPKKK